MIKIKVLLFTALFVTVSMLFTQTESDPVLTSAIVVDGKDNDWSDPMVIYVEVLDGMMGVANDDSSLILMFRFGNEELARKVMFGGATLWWHHDGKKKKEFGIKFPMQRQPGAMRERREQPNEQEMGRGREREMPSFPMELISPVFCIEKTNEKLPWSDVNGIAASASSKNEIFCFEFRIPLLPSNPYALLIKPGKKFKVCLELGEKMDKTVMRPPMEGGEGPSGGMGGGGGRGGMGGGGGVGGGGGRGPGGMPPGGGPSDMQSMFEPEEVWVTVQLH